MTRGAEDPLPIALVDVPPPSPPTTTKKKKKGVRVFFKHYVVLLS
jgi:hypothetical protein